MDSRKNRSFLWNAAKNEGAGGQLYIVYAERFPEMREFWSGLADDGKNPCHVDTCS